MMQPPVARPAIAPPEYQFPKTAEGLLSWPHVDVRLAESRNYWLATTRPDGRPHATPVWGVWVDDALYFDGHPATRWSRNEHLIAHGWNPLDISALTVGALQGEIG